MQVKTLIMTGYGINCDYETEHAFKLAGSLTEKVHVNDLISGRKNLENYHILAIPGGFSYADDVGAGKILANRLRMNIGNQISKFVQDGKLVIGICNGFQVMVKYPLLSKLGETQDLTLTFNDSGRFEDRWVYMKANPKSKCIWTKGIDKLYLPVRHGEGKLIAKSPDVLDDAKIALCYTDEKGNNNPPYPYNPNGSPNGIAGICDKTGRIFGLMPHPEAHLYKTNHPRWTREQLPTEGAGLQVFRNAVEYALNNL